MKPPLALVGGIHPPTLAELEQRYAVLRPTDAAGASDPVEVALTNGGRGMTGDEMRAMSGLKLVACFGVGVDAIDVATATTLGVKVTNTPDVLTDDVADLAMSLLLATVRRIAVADRYVRAGRWLDGPMPLTGSLRGKTLGVIGLGRIGQAIARRAEALGLATAYQGPRQKPVPYRYFSDPVALAHACDVLVAACPGGDGTRGVVSAAVIDALGPDGVFVNIARGSVVDEPALVDALVAGRLGGAGLDVFVDEPRVPDALFALDNVVLLPHVGSATHDTRAAMGRLVIANVDAWFGGSPLVTAVN